MLLCTMLLINCCTSYLYGSIQAEDIPSCFGWKHDTAPYPATSKESCFLKHCILIQSCSSFLANNVCAYLMTVYYHSASELEFCLRVYYYDAKINYFGVIVQYRVDCVIIPDTTESIAVRIVIMKCMLHCVVE